MFKLGHSFSIQVKLSYSLLGSAPLHCWKILKTNPDSNLKSIDRADDSKRVPPYYFTTKTLMLRKFDFFTSQQRLY